MNSPTPSNLLAFIAMSFFQIYVAKITLCPKGHQRCVQREIKLESTACHLRLINDFVTFIGIREV